MKLVIVDDHPIVREGLVALLRQIGPDTVVLEAASAPQALQLLTNHGDLDAVILDIAMPGMDGWKAITAFGQVRPDLPVIVLSSSEEPEDARRALAQGALGYVPKSASQHTLVSAIRMVLNGDLYLPPLLLAEAAGSSVRGRATASPGKAVLTDRQTEVLRLVSEGRSNLWIAHELDISEKTVKAHITTIFKALQVVNRTQAAAAARDAGII